MSKDHEQIVIGVDLDGVCADFYLRMREIAAEWFESDIDELPTEVSYGLSEWGIENEEQLQSLHRFAVTQRNFFETVPMISGARKYLRLLSKENYRIRIITHRLFIQYFHEVAVRQTITWLDANGIPYWDLCFMKDKAQVGAEIYIEDSPDNIVDLRDQGNEVICFANSTNLKIADPRAKTWKEVYEYVHKLAPKYLKGNRSRKR